MSVGGGGEGRIKMALNALEELGPKGKDAAAEIQKALDSMFHKAGSKTDLGLIALDKKPEGARGRGRVYTVLKLDPNNKPVVPETIELRLAGPTEDILIATVS